ncbi:hypothetical protein ACOTVD_09500 [Campylobacter jejuni]|uniref:hypothetical protein n=1 Tax=Campylobacter jejuni TaxID=197 RepID=UPI000875299B|nr:hypothetical protein [Campylobacter jejuni]EEU7470760.1 hypothetical protein [Campylobacter jejuni]MCW1355320.1 hypothetical protein [Campylobacter jejuni]OEV62153.1 hypothetical protein AJY73_10050 [Campylobacter jejuni]
MHTKNYLLKDIIPFSERRRAFLNFVNRQKIILEKNGEGKTSAFFIDAHTLKICIKSYQKEKKINFFDRPPLIELAFNDIKLFLGKI